MPARSKAQLRWVNSPSGHAALGGAGVKEWDSATKGRKLPERLSNKRVSRKSRKRVP
jgi:hypothetical protein